ncbi:two-partner secretion domain-containing protein [Achromobacter sp. ESBL13]|uniref:two-partner secretion domain-containing protein n=1 Tax=Achromobacter sp. ESBL13 TaxID=3077328 RepID=UPI002FC6A872
MNKTFALVWSASRGGWVAVSEGARRRGKSPGALRRIAVGAALMGVVGVIHAQDFPKDGVVKLGAVDITMDADKKTMRVNQKTDKLIIDWQRFDVGSDKHLIFNQPGRESVVLNKVLSKLYSDIRGEISANGSVFLINPNGVVFGQSSRVNVGSLLASTKPVSHDDFLGGGPMQLIGIGNAAITHLGSIVAHGGGSVILVADSITSYGSIQADMGSVALASGKTITLSLAGNSLIDLQVEGATLDPLIESTGLLRAHGGQVLLKGPAKDAMSSLVVNNLGVIEANSLDGKTGRIVLDGGDFGRVMVAGRLTATGGDTMAGGTVSIAGKSPALDAFVDIDTRGAPGRTGMLSIAAHDVNVAWGNTEAGATLSTSMLSKRLATSNVSLIGTYGNVTINAPVHWNGSTSLTLQAARHVDFNAPVTAVGDGAGLAAKTQSGDLNINARMALTGDNAALALIARSNLELNNGVVIELSGKGATYENRDGRYTVINDMSQWETMNQDLAGRYALGKSLEADGRVASIGGDHDVFTGKFEGMGHTLSKFEVNADNHAGLFAQSSGDIRNLNLEDISVTTAKGAQSADKAAGALVGTNSGTITNVHATGSRMTDLGAGIGAVGGLIGRSNGGTIDRSSVMASTLRATGGRVGGMIGDNNGGFISDSVANVTVQVSGNVHAGGFAGYNDAAGTLYNVQARGSVTHSGESGNGHFGGLVGANQATIAGSAAYGRVQVQSGSAFSVGGLAGYNGGMIDNAAAYGHTSGGDHSAVGGAVGYNNGTLAHTEARGNVSGRDRGDVGGLVGVNRGSIEQAVAHGTVRAEYKSRIGGLVGRNLVTAEIMDSAAHGDISGGLHVTMGGLAGVNEGLIHQSHARNSVNYWWGQWLLQTRGAVVGRNTGTVW